MSAISEDALGLEDNLEKAAERPELPVVPVRNLILFPAQVMPLTIGRETSLASVRIAQESGKKILVVAQLKAEAETPSPQELHRIGCTAEILKSINMPDGTRTIIVRGDDRFQVENWIQAEGHLEALGHVIAEEESEGVAVDALVQSVKTAFANLARLAPHLSGEHVVMAHNAETPGRLADLIAASLQLELDEKQRLLEVTEVEARLERVHRLLTRELEMMRLSSDIDSRVQGEITRSQREYYLRQQLEAIRRELGETEGEGQEVGELRRRLLAKGLPEAAMTLAERELRRLERMNPNSPDWNVARTWIDWLLDLPWGEKSDDRIDLEQARAILDRDHHDLDKVKRRILEYLAVRRLKKDMRGPILCFVGPPGVGKTSLGRSIAEALGRSFVRISLGGVRDEAEIRGHRRTYVGALPGRIIQSLKRAGTSNPVFVLDEIDKLGSGHQGDPSAALLEVLDPEQNASFSDHYLECEYDLSDVMFIATANWGDAIPGPLRDRMEIIEIPGYATHDKVKIAEGHLLPKQLREHGLDRSRVSLPRATLNAIVEDYTREAGVRELDRKIAAVLRTCAREIVEGQEGRRRVAPEDLKSILGPPRHGREVAERTRLPGVATGLAWTPVGGDILFVEATLTPGKGRLTLTGQLGDVMKESAQAALSIVKGAAADLGIEPDFLDRHDIHVHVPAGAVPKDGPSAGVTILSALVSLISERQVKSKVAMTGEISLRGLVLPVGGIKEKVLAAKRAGITTVILPERNRADLEEIPADCRESMRFVFVREVNQVLQHALVRRRSRSRRKPLLS
ncbi:MAG: endopeptidase La [Planctomycetes bacterium]|nr:endopeptidase La [Planctomycetota bacterium]